MFAQMSTHMSIEFAGVTAHGSPSRGHSKYPVVTPDLVISYIPHTSDRVALWDTYVCTHVVYTCPHASLAHHAFHTCLNRKPTHVPVHMSLSTCSRHIPVHSVCTRVCGALDLPLGGYREHRALGHTLLWPIQLWPCRCLGPAPRTVPRVPSPRQQLPTAEEPTQSAPFQSFQTTRPRPLTVDNSNASSQDIPQVPDLAQSGR